MTSSRTVEAGREREARGALQPLVDPAVAAALTLPGVLTPAAVLALQRAAGNRATRRALGRAAAAEIASARSVHKIGVVKYDGTPQLHVRQQPSRTSRSLGQLPFGARLQVIEKVGGHWLHVSTPHGTVGYVDAAINAGRARKVGNHLIVNGRTYGYRANERLYPIRGPGFHELNRPAFKALGVYNKFGNTLRAEHILDNMKTSQENRDAALKVWQAINP